MEISKSQFNWFPGHMNKALKEIEKQLPIVDLVIQVVDSRAPFSTQNTILQKLLYKKPMLFIFTKTDLSDIEVTKKWIIFLNSLGHTVFKVDNSGKSLYTEFKNFVYKLLSKNFELQKKRGIEIPQLNALICGVPNVGKSTFLNRISKFKRVKVANTPGVTRGLQRIRIDDNIVLIDSPGILPARIDTQAQGFILIACNAIKIQPQITEDFVLSALHYFLNNYPKLIELNYKISLENIESLEYDSLEVNVLSKIAKQFNFVYSNTLNFEKTIDKIIVDFSMNKFKLVSFEKPDKITGSDRDIQWNLNP
ncbi:ribosome biogenesis GTPase YlqF [Spiroplasma endosymbiont of Labia minor]|uniref:ribosome biogenesis GTPase YlqF n=1 Tax=Spiroplasma endosymbiont of Labia minor TaxID=3066305 RepID=UPI0030D00430